MNKRYTNILTIILLAVIIGSAPFFISSTHMEQREPVVADIPCTTTPTDIPETVVFAGQSIDLASYDRRERMDRELMAFTYMHSSTILMIKRANRFFPTIEPLLKANGIPDDFKYLMVIESNVNTLARSQAGAAGLWQFMQATGKEYGLEVNADIDERYHVEKATKAACKYLKASYATYGDWITVAAAYNAGNGRISGELRKQMASQAIDLWLVEETSRYMFRIMAAKLVFENPQQYGFLLKKEQLYPPIPCKETKVTTSISDLALFAKQNDISFAQLKDANPWLRGYSLENRTGKEYTLLIPDKNGMNYNPKETVAHSKQWVVVD